MKIIKKISSAILSFCLIIPLFACVSGLTGFAVNNTPAPENPITTAPVKGDLTAAEGKNAATSGTCGDNVTWSYDTETATLTISGTGAMSNYGYSTNNNLAPWQDYYKTMETVIIGNGVTSIGQNTFIYCTKLTSVTIPDSVTSIGGDAFLGCTGLLSVTIPDSVTSIGNYAFSGCKGLTSITIPDSVTNIGNYAFSNCTRLTSITIPDSVTNIGERTFSGCSSLEEMTLPFTGDKRHTASDTYQYPFGYIFGASGITDGTYVTQYYHGNSTSSTTNSTYYIPTSLKKVTLTDCEYIPYGAFYNCSMLTSITIPDSVTSTGNYAFYKCTGLTSITIPDSVTSISSSAFQSCSGLTKINYTGTVADWCGISFNNYSSNPLYYAHNLYINDQLVAGDLVIPDSVTSIGNYAFNRYTGLTSVTIPDSVTSIGSKAFEDCTGLTSITIPDSVTSIGGRAFYGCNELTTVYYTGTESDWNNISISADNGPLVNATRYYINSCDTETNWYIHNNVLHIIGTGTMDNYKTQTVVPWYEDRENITEVQIESGVEKIGSYAFYCLSNLEKVTVMNKDTVFGKYALNSGNENLTVYSKKGGAVEQYCNDNGITFVDPFPTATAPAAPDYASHTENSVTVAANELYEYSIDGETWQKENTFANLEKNVIYRIYQRVAETDEAYASEASPALVIAIPDKPVILRASYEDIKVKPVTGFEYCLDDMVWQSGTVFGMLIDEMEYKVYQRIALIEGEKVYQITSESTAVKTDNSIKETMSGDLNGDEEITDDDAVYLLFHTFFPDEYPIDGNADFDGDGEITDADAVYLLFYTFFPENYPIK